MKCRDFLNRPVDSAPLALFRIAFGLIMLFEVLHYFFPLLDSVLSAERFHFTYQFAPWVKPLPGAGMAIELALLALFSAGLALGLFYRVCAIGVTVLFTHVFLIDRIIYNNHFYLYCLVGLLLTLVAADAAVSIDKRRRGGVQRTARLTVPAWQLDALKALVVAVYFYGAVAKINSDWLAGEPVREWLRSAHDAPLVGGLLATDLGVYAIAWGGLLFDLCIGFLLWNRRTFLPAAVLVVLFHLFNLFWLAIGTFPAFGILSVVLFAPPGKMRALLDRVGRRFGPGTQGDEEPAPVIALAGSRPAAIAVAVIIGIQLVLPLRPHLQPGNVSWHECGHYFSWRMMLRKKLIAFQLEFSPGGEEAIRKHGLELAFVQSAAMAKDPGMLHCYAQAAGAAMRAEGIETPVVRANALVSLNGREFRHIVDPSVNLVGADNPFFGVPDWVLPLGCGMDIGRYPRTAEEQSAMIQEAIAIRAQKLAGAASMEP